MRATRHTRGTMLYRARKDLHIVQKHLGHARPTTTAIYADVLDEDLHSGVDEIRGEPKNGQFASPPSAIPCCSAKRARGLCARASYGATYLPLNFGAT